MANNYVGMLESIAGQMGFAKMLKYCPMRTLMVMIQFKVIAAIEHMISFQWNKSLLRRTNSETNFFFFFLPLPYIDDISYR